MLIRNIFVKYTVVCIGTTVFYIAGIVLVLGAAALLTPRRKSEQE